MEQLNSQGPSETLKCDAKIVALCEAISSKVGILISFVGLLVLVGWFFNIPFLRSLHPSFVTMKFNTALCFVLTGFSLWNLQSRLMTYRRHRAMALIAALGVLGLGSITFIEFLFRQNLGVDQFFYRELPGAVLTPYLGRMSFGSTINFSLTGIALFLIGAGKERTIEIGQLLAIPISILSLFSFLNYVLGAPFPVEAHFATVMALHTSLLFLLTFLGILFSRPQNGLMRHMTSVWPGGKLLRRFLPIGILLPLFLAITKFLLEKQGVLSNEAGIIFVAIGNLSVIAVYVYFLAVMLNRTAIEKEKVQRSSDVMEISYRMLFANTEEGVLILDGETGWIMDFNGVLQKMLGYSEDELHGKKPWEVDIFRGVVASPEAFFELYNKGFTRIENLRIRTRDGRMIDLDLVSTTFVSGRSKFAQWNFRDITERKREQERLLQLSCAVEQGPAEVVITDLSGNILYVNPRFTQITGYSHEEALGQNPRILKSGEHSAVFYQELWNTIKAGKVWRGQFLNKKKNGSLYWESASISPVFGKDGAITHYIAIKEDITELKKLERIKDDFVGTVSHEIRTPLTAIKESLNLVLDGSMGALNTEQKAFLDIGSRNVDRLTALVSSILDFQKLQAGKLDLRLSKCDLNEICSGAVALLKAVAEKKGLTLRFEATPGLPLVQVDRDRILQVVTSFISNGIKFTQTGGITVTAIRKGENCIRVAVADTGIGIAPEELEQLFKGFTILGPLEYHLTGSAGLGLAISKGIITQHRGKVGVESELGKGSVFFFEIPIEERRRSR